MTKNQVLKALKKHEKILKEKFHVGSLYLFGSIARGDSSAKSDVDLLVDFSSKEIGLFEFLRLKEFLESILGKRVDLVTRDAIKEWMRAAVEKESVRAA